MNVNCTKKVNMILFYYCHIFIIIILFIIIIVMVIHIHNRIIIVNNMHLNPSYFNVLGYQIFMTLCVRISDIYLYNRISVQSKIIRFVFYLVCFLFVIIYIVLTLQIISLPTQTDITTITFNTHK